MNDIDYMAEALKQAEIAYSLGEVPVGAVIARRGEIICRAHNLRETNKSALAHAETLAIDTACKILGGWHLTDCTLYVTLEPCVMCAGAVMNSRIDRVVFGAADSRFGAFGGGFDLNALPINHKCEVAGGVLENECRELLQKFFRETRERGKRV